VKLHPNAKTTPHTRALLVYRVRSLHWTVAATAEAAGIARRTAYKWLARHRHGGAPALADRSSRPQHQPRRTSAARVSAILAARQQRLPAWAIAQQLQLPRSTVAVILARAGLNRLRYLDPAPPVVRYERTQPGELVHLDIKPLARIRRVGHRIHGDRSREVHGAGYEYAFVALDDYSRAAYVEILPAQTAPATAGFFARTIRWFARRGVPIRQVLTDNGGVFLSHVFRHVAHRAGIRLRRTRPYRPQTNGKAERFIQTLTRQWAYAAAYPSSWRRTRALRPWLRYYNLTRPHAALAYRPPCVRFPRLAQ
jgi:transposase InsO family protein